MTPATLAPAPKVMTHHVYLGLIDPEDRDTRDDSYPLYASTGSPAFDRFRGEWHVEDWVKFGSPNGRPRLLPSWKLDLEAQAARRNQYEDFLRGQGAE